MKIIRVLITSALILSLIFCVFSCGRTYGKLIETKSDGDFSFDLYGKDGTVLKIKVKKSGNKMCELSCNGKDFKSIDLNFDGYNDIMLSSAEKGPGYYQCFIYQPNTEKFTRNLKFDNMLDPILDPETKTISCDIKTRTLILKYPEEAYKEVRGSAVWSWKNGILTQVSEEGIEYFTDSKIYCVYTSSEIDGEFTRNDAGDLWFWSYDELVSAGYTWEN